MELEVRRVAAQRSGKGADTQEGLGFITPPTIPTPPGNIPGLLWEYTPPSRLHAILVGGAISRSPTKRVRPTHGPGESGY